MSTVTFTGNELHLDGKLPEVGKKAPDFSLVANDLKRKTMSDFKGKVLVLVTVPSLDTPVCDLEAKRFNEEAGKIDKAHVVVVSCDLPFAQARWQGAACASNVETLSDYMHNSFGKHYGILIQELQLLARAIFVIDANGILTYSQLVPEVTNQPDFDAALEAIKKTI